MNTATIISPDRKSTYFSFGPSLIRLWMLAALLLLATALVPTNAYAQEEPDVFTPGEVCDQVADVFAGMSDNERQIDVRLNELRQEFKALQGLAAQYVEYINPNVTSDENRRFQVLFWIVMIQMQGVNSEISQLEASRAQIDFEREVFTQISEAFACGDEEEEEEATPISQLRSSCNVKTGSAINWAKLNQLTFVVVEDPNPAQEDIRWIEFQVALTSDPGQRNPSVWLERAIDWAEGKKAEGWVELGQGGVGQFCTVIADNCITPPSGISPSSFTRLCGGD